MTYIKYYVELSTLIEDYKFYRIDHKEAVKRLTKLNIDAKEFNLELEADIKIFENINIVDEDYVGYE